MSSSRDEHYILVTDASDSVIDFGKELRKFLREIVTQGIWVFAFFGAPTFVMAGTISKVLLKVESWLLPSLGFSALVGLVAVALCQFVLVKHSTGTLKDLFNRRAAQIQLNAKQAVNVRITDSGLDAIVLDCGQTSLVLVGGWWQKQNYRQLVTEATCSFPCSSMTIRFLPSSGRVLSVTGDGEILKVRFAKSPSPPVLMVKHDRGAEIIKIENAIDSILSI